jgi:hypothetical protein
MKIYQALIASLIFLALLFIVYFAHINYFNVNVVFYAAIADVVIACPLVGMFLFISSRFNIFSQFEKLQLIIIWLLIGYALAITLPTVIDRSLSFYILEKLEQRGGGIKLNAFEEVFTKEYVKEHRLVDVRLTEQKESGTINILDGCVKLTEKGKKLVVFSTGFRRNFLPKKRLLMGEYSSDLIDPFRESIKSSNYECN